MPARARIPLTRGVRRLTDARQDLAQAALDLADRLAAGEGEQPLLFADTLVVPAAPPAPETPPLTPAALDAAARPTPHGPEPEAAGATR